jgi:hypothetical protein
MEFPNNGLFSWRALFLGRSFPTENVFGMTLFRRRPREVMYMAVHLHVMRRRIWFLLPAAIRSSKRVQREETSPRVKGRKT